MLRCAVIALGCALLAAADDAGMPDFGGGDFGGGGGGFGGMGGCVLQSIIQFLCPRAQAAMHLEEAIGYSFFPTRTYHLLFPTGVGQRQIVPKVQVRQGLRSGAQAAAQPQRERVRRHGRRHDHEHGQGGARGNGGLLQLVNFHTQHRPKKTPVLG